MPYSSSLAYTLQCKNAVRAKRKKNRKIEKLIDFSAPHEVKTCFYTLQVRLELLFGGCSLKPQL